MGCSFVVAMEHDCNDDRLRGNLPTTPGPAFLKKGLQTSVVGQFDFHSLQQIVIR